MNGIPSYYKSDDLMLAALYDEGCKICGNKPFSQTLDYPADCFDSKTQKKEKLKKGLKIAGIVALAAGLAFAGVKGFSKIKQLLSKGATASAAASGAAATVSP